MITETEVNIFLSFFVSILFLSFLIGFIRGLSKSKIWSILSACFFIFCLGYGLISMGHSEQYSINVGAFLGVILGCMCFYFLFVLGKFLGKVLEEKRRKILKLNFIGLISAILAFISIILPWYSIFSISTTFNLNLLDFANNFANIAQLVGGIPGGLTFQTWFIWVALALIIIGGLLGLLVSFIIRGKGKSLIAVAGILVLLSPIIFAVGLASQGCQLFGSATISRNVTVSFFTSFGFFLAITATILMFISREKHPMEAEAVPLVPVASPPSPPQS